jgi:hypothetical protein
MTKYKIARWLAIATKETFITWIKQIEQNIPPLEGYMQGSA